MSNNPIQVITSVQRRRRWNAAEKQELVSASLAPGASVSSIAREAGIHPSQLYGWRRQLRATEQPIVAFAPVRIAAAATVPTQQTCGTIEIEFARGSRVRITGTADPSLVSAALAILAKTERRQ